MVSRTTPAQTPLESPPDVPRALFDAWRRMLAVAWLALRELSSRAIRVTRLPAGPRPSARNLASGRTRWGSLLGRFGPAAAAIGTVTGLVAGTLGDGTLGGAMLFSVEACAWAACRLLLLSLTGPRATRRPSTLLPLWGAGLTPYIVGLSPWLRAAAFVASAAVTYRLLLSASDGDGSSVRRAIAWSFGGQTVAVTLSWIVVNGLVFLPMLLR